MPKYKLTTFILGLTLILTSLVIAPSITSAETEDTKLGVIAAQLQSIRNFVSSLGGSLRGTQVAAVVSSQDDMSMMGNGSGSEVSMDYISGHFDRVPNFTKNPTKIVSAADAPAGGNVTWSELFNAGNLGTVGRDDIILIQDGASVLFDSTNVNVHSLGVEGSLIFSRTENTSLKATNILVYRKGYLEVGTESNPIPSNIRATITIADTPLNNTLSADGPFAPNGNGVWDPESFGTALIVFGKLRMHGSAMNRTFSRAATELFATQGTITLEDNISGWKVGDRIIIPDTREMLGTNTPRQGGTYDPQWEEFSIRAISGNTITLGDKDDASVPASLRFDHLGARDGDFDPNIPGDKGNLEILDVLDLDGDGNRTEPRLTKEGKVMKFLPHVMNISRNIVIKSENQAGVRGHTIYLARADVDVRYVQYKDMGRTLNKPLDTTVFDVDVYDNQNVLLGTAEVTKGSIVGKTGFPSNNTVEVHMGEVRVMRAGVNIADRTDWRATYIGTNQIARYAIHTHHLIGPVTPQSNGYQFTFLGNAVENLESFDPSYTPTHPKESHDGENFPKWAIAIHGSHFGLIKDNAVYNIAGSAIVTEDGSETGNVFERNMVVRAKSIRSGWRFSEENGFMSPRNNRVNFGHTGRDAVGFWLRGPYNYVRDNVAANVLAYDQPDTAYGFKYIHHYLGSHKIPQDAAGNFLQGVDPRTDARAITADMNAKEILQFENNEAYGAMESAITLWWVGTFGNTVRTETKQSVIKDFKVWHISNSVIYFYPAHNFLIDGVVVRGDGNKTTACCGIGIHWGDYQATRQVIQNVDSQGGRTAISLPTKSNPDQPDGYSEVTLRNSFLRAQNTNLTTSLTFGVTGGGDPTPRRHFIENVKYAAWPGKNTTNIRLAYPAAHVNSNLIAVNEVYVVNYDSFAREDGDDFRAYYPEQAPDFIVPMQGSQKVGSPEAGLTNTENWAKHGIAIAGSITPCLDKTSYPKIIGFTCGIQQTNNTRPVAGSISNVTAVKGTPVTFTLTGSDAENSNLSFAILNAPSNGRLNSSSLPSVTYTPNQNFLGEDSFTFKVNDGALDSEGATVRITVVEDVVAENVRVKTSIDTAATFSLSAYDVDGNPVTYTILSQPLHGSLNSASLPQVVYSPNSGFRGEDTFTYVATNGNKTSPPATVTINVYALLDGVVAFYDFEEGSGSVANDGSAGGNDGAIDGATYTTEAKVGNYALDFDGNDFVAVPTSADLDMRDEVSIELWVRPRVSKGHVFFVGKASELNSPPYLSYGFRSNDRGQPFFTINSSPALNQIMPGPVLNQWTQLVGTYSATGDLKVYLNGNLYRQQTAAGPMALTSRDLYIGNFEHNTAQNGFVGLIDNVRVYDRALSATEVQTLHNLGSSSSNPPTTPPPPTTPTPSLDSDQDGVPNTLDRCPDTLLKYKDLVNLRGCPVPRALTFDIKPDLNSLEALRQARNLELGITEYGKVTFTNKQIALITNSGDEVNLDRDIKISRHQISINTTNLPDFNQPATITFYNVTVKTPVIKRDGVVCTTCTIQSFSNGTLVVNVTGFSTYTVEEVALGETPTPPTPATPTDTVTPRSSGGGGGGGGSRKSTETTPLPTPPIVTPTTPTVTPTTPSPLPTFTPTFTYRFTLTDWSFLGYEHEGVRQLQKALNHLGFTIATTGSGSPNNETTYFGPATEAALKRFQTTHNIVTSGSPDTTGYGALGPSTRDKLNQLLAASPAPTSDADRQALIQSLLQMIEVLMEKLRALG